MYCKKCGKELDDSFKACPYCMAPVADEAPGQKGASPDKKKTVVIILCAVIVVIVLAIGAFILGKSKQDKADTSGADSSQTTTSAEAAQPSSEPAKETESTTAVTEPSTTAKPAIEPTGSDWDNLTALTEKIDLYGDFDCKTASTNDVFEILYFCLGMPLYDDLISQTTVNYEQENFLITVDGFNWLAKNVFNIKPETVDSFTYDGEKYGSRSGDNYVIKTITGTGYEGLPVFEQASKDKNSDGTYTVVFNVYEMDMETGYRTDYLLGTASLNVKLKEADGKRFWSIYSIDYEETEMD